MASSDPIADFLTKIRNALGAKHRYVDIRWSKIKQFIAEIFKKYGFIENYLVKQDNKNRGTIRVFLKYNQGRLPVIQGLRRVSTPGLRQYVGHQDIPRFYGGLGVPILSTSQGIMSGYDAHKKGIGGELLLLNLVSSPSTRKGDQIMSRKGKQPLVIPKNVEVKISSEEITVKGPKGVLSQKLIPSIQFRNEEGMLFVELAPDHEKEGHFHGLYRSLIANMVEGTSKGFTKELEMVGVGYRAAVQGRLVDLQVGFSHPTKIPIPDGLEVKVEKNTAISISGIDKHKVGHFAAIIRGIKPPEPYQGKGIRYKNEYVRKKAGKTAAKK